MGEQEGKGCHCHNWVSFCTSSCDFVIFRVAVVFKVPELQTKFLNVRFDIPVLVNKLTSLTFLNFPTSIFHSIPSLEKSVFPPC